MKACALLLVAAAGVGAQTACDAPDTTNAKCTCNGQEYDFSQIQPSDGNSYFSGPDANNEYMYYFQMTGGGLPADDGAMPYCTFGAGVQNGNSAGQGEITGTSCFPIGQVTQQQWTIDTTQNPQVIQITFSGGQEGRQSVLSVTCDPSADSPTFSVKGETRTLVYEMDVTSKFACSGGGPAPPSPGPPSPGPPSPGPPPPSGGQGKKKTKSSPVGDIIVILFFTTIPLYLVGMSYFMKRQSGEWVLPHKETMGNVMTDAKEGCRFLISKVKRSEYQSL